jgi:predicted metal-dependent phosphotriesterase family hydrolase
MLFQTVLGDVTEKELGFCQPHEHVYIVGTIDQEICPLIRINNLPASANELKLYREAGGNSVVDANPLATGRDALALQDISRLSGVNIIATTGYHIPKFYPDNHWIWSSSKEELSEMFISELTQGMFLEGYYEKPTYQTDIKAGLIKAMMTEEGLDNEQTKKCLTAAGYAAKATGASVMIHTEFGKDSLRAIDLLAGKIGIGTDKILICHVDRQVEDLTIHKQIASTGVFMEYDTITLLEFHDNAAEIKMMRYMIDNGFLNQLLISTDPETDRMKNYGGRMGVDYILTQFIPMLKLNGFTQEEINQITKLNPAHALAISK